MDSYNAVANSGATKIVGFVPITPLRVAVVGFGVDQRLQAALRRTFGIEPDLTVARNVNCAVQTDLRTRWADF